MGEKKKHGKTASSRYQGIHRSYFSGNPPFNNVEEKKVKSEAHFRTFFLLRH